MKICTCGDACRCEDCTCRAYSALFDTLGNTTRLQILSCLLDGPKSVSGIIAHTSLEQTNVSHALKRLQHARMVSATRKGRFRLYAASRTVVPLMRAIEQHVAMSHGQSRSTKSRKVPA
jgi:DNA-binding transcriptional ArsR family regulator